MCVICIDIDRSVLTSSEARRNLNEMCDSLESNHIKTVYDKIMDLIDRETKEYGRLEDEYCESCGCESCACGWRYC
jgi:hypothetical protein